MISWNECKKYIATMPEHYGLGFPDQELMFKYLKDIKNDSVIVELGTCNGRTSAMLAYVADKTDSTFHTIDNFSLESDAETVRENLDKLGFKYNLYVGNTNLNLDNPYLHTLNQIKPEDILNRRQIDFLFIDAGHDPANVKSDCEIWMPHMAKDSIVVFDDCTLYFEDFNDGSCAKEFEVRPDAYNIENINNLCLKQFEWRDKNPHWGVGYFGYLSTRDWTVLEYNTKLLVKKNG